MKKLFLLLCTSVFAFANINVVVSILPLEYFVTKIGGDKVNISTMVQPGNSPHTYEPKPSQMKDITHADIYFKIGIEFEKAWLSKFIDLNKNMLMVDSSKGIKRIPLGEHSHGDEDGDKAHEHEDGLDPHVWLSPKNGKIIAQNIYEAFIKVDEKNKDYYRINYHHLLKEIAELDKQINDILLKSDDMAKFMVFHPSWGYFAKQYRLTQVAIEANGKEPKPKQIKEIIKATKKDYIEVIITAPEFSDKVANSIAKESGVNVVKISPLSKNWDENLLKFARAVAKQN
ncbi:MAG: zinc ABC transporter substrate-binding protein [Campylobacterales bacterium]|nr:zinc ABC transporter substrate-binding protein [Campylobacterales bacterium]